MSREQGWKKMFLNISILPVRKILNDSLMNRVGSFGALNVHGCRSRDSFVSYSRRKTGPFTPQTLPNWVHPVVVALYGVSKYLSLPSLILLSCTVQIEPLPLRGLTFLVARWDKECACLYLKAADRMECTMELSPHVVSRSKRRFLHLVWHVISRLLERDPLTEVLSQL